MLDCKVYTRWETDGVIDSHSATVSLLGGVNPNICAIVIETLISYKTVKDFEVCVSENDDGAYTMVIDAQYSNTVTVTQ